MPVHERLHQAGDSSDLSSEGYQKGVAGNVGNADVRDGTNPMPLGASRPIAVPTGVSAADSVTANAIDVTYTAPAGCSNVEIVVRRQDTDAFVKKLDSASSPETVTGLTVAVTYDFYVRGLRDSDGALGPFAAKVSATVA